MSQTRVAVVGASSDRRKFGNKAVRAFVDAGCRVFPVNPGEEAVEGLPAHANVESIPDELDVVTMYVPPFVGVRLLPGIAQKKPREVWLNPGAESTELLAEANRLALPVIVACSILGYGKRPGNYPDV